MTTRRRGALDIARLGALLEAHQGAHRGEETRPRVAARGAGAARHRQGAGRHGCKRGAAGGGERRFDQARRWGSDVRYFAVGSARLGSCSQTRRSCGGDDDQVGHCLLQLMQADQQGADFGGVVVDEVAREPRLFGRPVDAFALPGGVADKDVALAERCRDEGEDRSGRVAGCRDQNDAAVAEEIEAAIEAEIGAAGEVVNAIVLRADPARERGRGVAAVYEIEFGLRQENRDAGQIVKTADVIPMRVGKHDAGRARCPRPRVARPPSAPARSARCFASAMASS